jgi:phosphoglycerate dehydrogenase-like enzyme
MSRPARHAQRETVALSRSKPAEWSRLQSLGELAVHEGPGRMPAERFEPLLAEMELLIGQSDMPKARLDRAPKLRAIVNVETNFLQNVDYETCFARGIHMLAPGSAFARPARRSRPGPAVAGRSRSAVPPSPPPILVRI